MQLLARTSRDFEAEPSMKPRSVIGMMLLDTFNVVQLWPLLLPFVELSRLLARFLQCKAGAWINDGRAKNAVFDLSP